MSKKDVSSVRAAKMSVQMKLSGGKMSIKVIERSTADRRKELAEFFEELRPYLDEGMTLRKAVNTVRGVEVSSQRAWYKELREYAKEQGYDARY